MWDVDCISIGTGTQLVFPRRLDRLRERRSSRIDRFGRMCQIRENDGHAFQTSILSVPPPPSSFRNDGGSGLLRSGRLAGMAGRVACNALPDCTGRYSHSSHKYRGKATAYFIVIGCVTSSLRFRFVWRRIGNLDTCHRLAVSQTWNVEISADPTWLFSVRRIFRRHTLRTVLCILVLFSRSLPTIQRSSWRLNGFEECSRSHGEGIGL